jgi:[acyl-carrier-protein] S-malonyltransferase
MPPDVASGTENKGGVEELSMADKVCVFAGQGAQAVGMGKDLAAADPAVMALFDRANQVTGVDLKKIVFEGPMEELTKSSNCQPAIFVTSVACWTAFRKQYPAATFKMAAGLSLGEWTALHAAGVLDFDSTLRVLEARGRFMQQACEEQAGGMISVMGATQDQLKEICAKTGLVMANINSDAQVVLSGAKAGVDEAAKLAAAAGLKGIVLPVAGAFHSPLMASARERLAAVLKDVAFKTPAMPVLANVTGQPHAADGAAIRDAMLRQVTESVRWADCIRTAMAAGAGTFVEFGPGKVLSGLIKRIDKQNATFNVSDAGSLAAAAPAAN